LPLQRGSISPKKMLNKSLKQPISVNAAHHDYNELDRSLIYSHQSCYSIIKTTQIYIFTMLASSIIDASLSAQNLAFRPGGSAVSFGVSVINRSNQFASFQLEVKAAGAGDRSNWYRLSPDVSTAKSPGDRTDFQVEILDSPIPDFVGSVNLTVRVFSPQLSEERRLVLRLTLEPSSESNRLRIGLPSERFQVYPRNIVDIPVTVKNIESQPYQVRLQCTELESSWLVGSPERYIEIPANGETTVTFQCQPPRADRVVSRDYPFIIIAKSHLGSTVEAQGILEVLPVGFMHFEVQPQQQRIPAKKPWWPNWRSRSATFLLIFKNNSNLLQTLEDLEVRGQDAKRCQIEVSPEKPVLPLGEITPTNLTISPHRPWIGWSRKLKFELKPWLSDPRLGSADPATQMLFLKVFPIVPLWLLLALLSMIAAAVLAPTPTNHLAGVNVVRLSGTSGRSPLVMSVSDDCSIRTWGVTDWGKLNPQGNLSKGTLAKTCTNAQPKSSKGLLAITQQAIRSLALVPVKNNQVFAGLENGTIQVWDINTGKGLYTLKDPKDQTSDRILDLMFTRNSLTLYASYGSGTIRSWQRPSDVRFDSQPAKILQMSDRFPYQAWSLALSPDEKLLVSAGQFKRLILWDVANSQPRQLKLSEDAQNRGENDFFWDVNFAPNTSILAAADSDGYVTIWDLSQCQKAAPKKLSKEQLPEQSCEQRERWQVSKTSVRSILFTPDQRWLVSAGDDGQILAWRLTANLTPDRTQKPQQIATLPSRITSLDLIAQEQGVWIASGSADAQVRLYRFNPDK
jgi:WD40 repeat protein